MGEEGLGSEVGTASLSRFGASLGREKGIRMESKKENKKERERERRNKRRNELGDWDPGESWPLNLIKNFCSVGEEVGLSER